VLLVACKKERTGAMINVARYRTMRTNPKSFIASKNRRCWPCVAATKETLRGGHGVGEHLKIGANARQEQAVVLRPNDLANRPNSRRDVKGRREGRVHAGDELSVAVGSG
jgi:hypothetical protein